MKQKLSAVQERNIARRSKLQPTPAHADDSGLERYRRNAEASHIGQEWTLNNSLPDTVSQGVDAEWLLCFLRGMELGHQIGATRDQWLQECASSLERALRFEQEESRLESLTLARNIHEEMGDALRKALACEERIKGCTLELSFKGADMTSTERPLP